MSIGVPFKFSYQNQKVYIQRLVSILTMLNGAKTEEMYPFKERLLITILAVLGSYIEWYDYFIAATAASLVWGDVFFSAYPSLATAFSISAFGVAYFTRPIGAYIWGHVGDKYGRKSSMIYTLLTVSIGMLGITVLPSSYSIGIIAPILLFTFRSIQGIGFGGEYGGAATWVLETNAKSKWRGTWTSSVMSAVGLGGGTGAGIFLYLEHTVSRAALLSFWWRIPFLIGTILLVVAGIIRYYALESNIFIKLQKAGKVLKNPANAVIKKQIGIILLLATAWLYIYWVNPATIQLFAVPYLTHLHIANAAIYVTYAIFISDFIIAFTTILGGFLSDLIGRRSTIIVSALGVAILIYPYLYLIKTGIFINILLATILLNGLAFIGEGSFTAFFPEIYNTNVRYSGSGLSYQFSAFYMGFIYTFALPLILISSYVEIYMIIITLLFVALALIVRLRTFEETKNLDLSI